MSLLLLFRRVMTSIARGVFRTRVRHLDPATIVQPAASTAIARGPVATATVREVA